MHWSLSSFKNISAYQKVLSGGALTQAFQYFIILEKKKKWTLHLCIKGSIQFAFLLGYLIGSLLALTYLHITGTLSYS